MAPPENFTDWMEYIRKEMKSVYKVKRNINGRRIFVSRL